MKATKVAYIAVGLLIISLFYSYKLSKDNEGYERYLSSEIANQISPLSTSIYENVDILEVVLQKELITAEIAELLEGNFKQIGMQSQEILSKAHHFNRIENDVKNKAAIENSTISYFFEKIKQECDANGKCVLSKEQMEEIRTYKTLVDHYKKIVEEELIAIPVKDSVSNEIAHIHYGMPKGYWDAYTEAGIIDDYWVNIIIRMADRSLYFPKEETGI